ncbi:MAG: hypothetical protein AB7O62_10845 [Pirellulales bacterium]
MNAAHSIAVLNRLLARLCRSLPQYLADGFPWHRPGDQRGPEVLQQIIADQQAMAGRVAEAVLDRRGAPDSGEFPMDFTDTQFLSLDFLVRELIHYQQQDVAAIARCASELIRDRAARELAEEALGQARAHLEALEELARQPA